MRKPDHPFVAACQLWIMVWAHYGHSESELGIPLTGLSENELQKELFYLRAFIAKAAVAVAIEGRYSEKTQTVFGIYERMGELFQSGDPVAPSDPAEAVLTRRTLRSMNEMLAGFKEHDSTAYNRAVAAHLGRPHDPMVEAAVTALISARFTPLREVVTHTIAAYR